MVFVGKGFVGKVFVGKGVESGWFLLVKVLLLKVLLVGRLKMEISGGFGSVLIVCGFGWVKIRCFCLLRIFGGWYWCYY